MASPFNRKQLYFIQYLGNASSVCNGNFTNGLCVIFYIRKSASVVGNGLLGVTIE